MERIERFSYYNFFKDRFHAETAAIINVAIYSSVINVRFNANASTCSLLILFGAGIYRIVNAHTTITQIRDNGSLKRIMVKRLNKSPEIHKDP